MAKAIVLPVTSFVSQKLALALSPIHGKGLFAVQALRAGEVTFIKGGHVVRRSDIWTTSVINSYLPLDDEFVIGALSAAEEDGIKLFVNHSCDPNCGLRGEITFVALRDIAVGEEVTCDYAMIDNEHYEFNCGCGSTHCRGVVTGVDWKRPELQARYGKFFARYLLDKMR